mgnify:CR=1 FL=1
MPAEIVFDQGLGALFVIRVAGNIVAPSQVGSVEFAAEKFGTRLVVVLGHSNCGAVTATLDHLQNPGGQQSRNLHSIVDRIRPAVATLLEALPERAVFFVDTYEALGISRRVLDATLLDPIAAASATTTTPLTIQLPSASVKPASSSME